MGTWNTGIFDDDIAMDVKAEFEEAMEEGLSIKEATEQILEMYEEELEDEETSIYLAIAALQLEKGTIQKNIKKRVLEIIESGQDLERWEETDIEDFKNREKVLNELRDRIVSLKN